MEIILFIVALVVLDLLASRFGHDSRPSVWDDERRRLSAPTR
jgi:hypothetical protein